MSMPKDAEMAAWRIWAWSHGPLKESNVSNSNHENNYDMNNVTHTEIPWSIEMEDERGVYISSAETDFIIATLECEPPDEVTRENARFIVKAVNHHQELVTRLYNLVNELGIQNPVKIELTPALALRFKEAQETLKKVIQ